MINITTETREIQSCIKLPAEKDDLVALTACFRVSIFHVENSVSARSRRKLGFEFIVGCSLVSTAVKLKPQSVSIKKSSISWQKYLNLSHLTVHFVNNVLLVMLQLELIEQADAFIIHRHT